MLEENKDLFLAFIAGGVLSGTIVLVAMSEPTVSEVPAPKISHSQSESSSPKRSPAPIAERKKIYQKGSESQYRDEIVQYIIDPCFAQIARRNLTQFISEKQAIDLLKATDKGAIENVIKLTLPLIKEATLSERKKIYEFGVSRCVGGAGF